MVKNIENEYTNISDMKKNQRTNIDGFTPRVRRTARLDQPGSSFNTSSRESANADTHTLRHQHTSSRQHGMVSERTGETGMETAARSIRLDDERSFQPKHKKARKPIIRRIILSLITLFAIGLLGFGVFLGYKFIIASGNVFQGGVLGYLQAKDLRVDSKGRSNILIFGTSEDNYEGGKQHEGAYLTDSIIVLSISKEKKDAYMFSLPRDLWVKYDIECIYGNEGKLNALFECYSDNGTDEKAGANALMKKVTQITGMDMQYYAHVNYSVVKDAVDAVGGVEVDIQGTGQYANLGILDRNFDWRCNYECYYVKYENGPSGIMDGEHALALARARGEGIQTYGLANANYDREVNQQKILKALREKAVSVGTLSDIGKVTKLIDAFGTNLRTNFDTTEIRTLADMAMNINNETIKSISLIDDSEPVTTVGFVGPQSIVKATSGIYDYSSIKKYIAKKTSGNQATQEEAALAIYNATNVAGVAARVQQDLESVGYDVMTTGNAPEGDSGNIIYVLNKNTEATVRELSEKYKATIVYEVPTFSYNVQADCVIVIHDASVISSDNNTQ